MEKKVLKFKLEKYNYLQDKNQKKRYSIIELSRENPRSLIAHRQNSNSAMTMNFLAGMIKQLREEIENN